MAGADYYYHELNLSDFTLIPDYKDGVEIQAPIISISQEEAYQIACDYWDFTPGDVADETGFELFVTYDTTVTSQNSGKTYYCYLLRPCLKNRGNCSNQQEGNGGKVKERQE